MAEKSTQRHIYFTEKQVELGRKKAASLGMTFNDWIKFMVNKEIEPLSEFYEYKKDLPDKTIDIDNNLSDSDLIEELRRDAKIQDNEDYSTLPY